MSKMKNVNVEYFVKFIAICILIAIICFITPNVHSQKVFQYSANKTHVADRKTDSAVNYNNKQYIVYEGKRGGLYIKVDNKKVYVTSKLK